MDGRAQESPRHADWLCDPLLTRGSRMYSSRRGGRLRECNAAARLPRPIEERRPFGCAAMSVALSPFPCALCACLSWPCKLPTAIIDASVGRCPEIRPRWKCFATACHPSASKSSQFAKHERSSSACVGPITGHFPQIDEACRSMRCSAVSSQRCPHADGALQPF
jgi:hypothetical protein